MRLKARVWLIDRHTRPYTCLSIKRGVDGIRRVLPFFRQLDACTNEITEKWMRAIGSTLKLWMKLRAHKPGMVRQFYNFDQVIIGRATANDHAMSFHTLTKFVVELVAMPVTLENNGFTISLVGFGTRGKATDPVTEPHGTTFFSHLSLRVHQINDGIGGLRIKFAAISPTQPKYMAGKFDDRNLHSQA